MIELLPQGLFINIVLYIFYRTIYFPIFIEDTLLRNIDAILIPTNKDRRSAIPFTRPFDPTINNVIDPLDRILLSKNNPVFKMIHMTVIFSHTLLSHVPGYRSTPLFPLISRSYKLIFRRVMLFCYYMYGTKPAF